MNISNYKAFLFDVDKTLTHSDRKISEKTKVAIHSLVLKGYKVGVCTGRHFASLHKLLPNYFPLDAIHVLAGGGLIVDTVGKIYNQKNIADAQLHFLQLLAEKYDCRFLVQSGTSFYGNEKAIKKHGNYMLAGNTDDPMYPLTDLPKWSAPLVVIGGITDECIEELRLLPLSFKVMLSYSGERYADVTAQGVNKSVGIQEWCKIQNVKPEEIIGFGDSENDVEFLETVGYAVAMGNATESVKKIANEVTDSCDQDGVALWIEKNI